MKIFWIHASLVAIVMALAACSTSRPTSSPPELVIESPIVGSPSPTPTVTGDPFVKGVDKAASATSLAQSAQTPEDWNLVLTQWQRAIAFMKAVPTSSPNHAAAQKLLPSYQQALARVQQQAKRGGTQTAVAAKGGSAEDGTPLIAGGQPSANPDTAKDTATTAIATVKALLQQQTEFFAKQKRYAPTLAELGSSIPADTPNYAYSTDVLPSKQAIAIATAKQDGLPSYAGVTLLVKDDKNNDTPITTICVTSKPSKTPPAIPQLVDKDIQCPSGATKV
ncbi:MAG: type IV pilin-like G/H family protein [Stenomitos rutilans HA7619-LM2]|jgi:hypothetical protein|nr:type IV pilin-like G/H family protein [Stenomitos rutilans HA7619-LM2]